MNSRGVTEVRRILAICTSHIGGVLLITPALEILHQFFPSAEISVLVRKGTDAVLRNNPVIKHIFLDGEITGNQQMHQRTRRSLARRISQVPEGLKLVGKLRRQKFDLAVNFSGSDRAAIVAFLSGAKERVGYTLKGGFAGKKWLFTQLYPRPSQVQHNVLQHTSLAFEVARSYIGNSAAMPCVGPLVLHPPAEDMAWAKAEWQKLGGQSPRILIHPASRVHYKCWAGEKWARVIEELTFRTKGNVLMTGSPDPKEHEIVKTILDTCNAKPAVLLGCLTLNQLAALIMQSDLFLGVDSAPMHIAAAVGTAVVALFGPSMDARWGPWGSGHRVIRRPCACLESKKSSCSAGQIARCMAEIPTEEVYQTALEVLSELQQSSTKLHHAAAFLDSPSGTERP
jgi:heptosyltransferase-3